MNTLNLYIAEIDEKIKQKEKELEQLREQLRITKLKKSPYSIMIIDLAELWHSSFLNKCHDGWYHETWENPGSARTYVAKLIQKMLVHFTEEQIKLFCKIKKEFNYAIIL